MKMNRQTVSLCPVCYKEIPATVFVDGSGAVMRKTCDVHGQTEAMVERDPLFYTWVVGLRSPSIYGGYFIDITRTCQLRCNPCYYPLEKKDPAGYFSVAEIVNDCRVNSALAPFILTGGEPTLHKDLPKIISELSKIGGVELLSNGVKLADREYFNDVAPLIANRDGSINLNLSIHKETDKWKQVIDHCREDGLQIESCLLVIRDKESFLEAVKFASNHKDVVRSFRIKAETAIWNQNEIGGGKVFVSDMLSWLQDAGHVTFVLDGRHNKPVYINVIFDGAHLMLLSWHDIWNVDLKEISCPPYYRARSGEICNFVTAGLINQGMDSGWIKGRRIESILPPAKAFKISSVRQEPETA